jgi:hypothetical protein
VAAMAPDLRVKVQTHHRQHGNDNNRNLLVQFYDRSDFEIALRSPEAVCSNRFVHIKRCDENVVNIDQLPPKPVLLVSGGKGGKGKGKGGKGGKGRQQQQQQQLGGGGGGGGSTVENEDDNNNNEEEEERKKAALMAELANKSGEEQLKLKLSKAKELAAKQDELKKQRRSTWEKQLKDYQEMKDKLAAKSGTENKMAAFLDGKVRSQNHTRIKLKNPKKSKNHFFSHVDTSLLFNPFHSYFT